MSNYLIFDVVIALVLLVSVLHGWRRGLVLSVLNLVAVLVALVGAYLVADNLAPPVAQYFQPKLESSFAQKFEDSDLANVLEQFAQNDGVSDLPADALADALQSAGVSHSVANVVAELSQDGLALVSDVATAMAESLARSVAFFVLFLLSFVVILIGWTVVSHFLNLVAKLPVLSLLNSVGGGLFGLVMACLLLFTVAWLLQILDVDIPSQAVANTHLLPIFLGETPLSILSNFLPTLERVSQGDIHS